MRRNHQQFVVVTLLGSALAGPALAQTGPLDARSLRPAVMLLVDTSGSMERVPDDGTNPNCDSCVPACTGDTLVDRNSKTRWALTVEALTGTIQNYSCTSEDRSRSPYQSDWYDYGYYLPHINFNPNNNLVQATDGILDSFASRVKFGLMTFDGVGTTIGGDTLVGPYSQWWTTPSTINPASGGALGMYSYGDPGRLAFPGCPFDYGINAGARGPTAPEGGLISVPASDTLDDIVAANNRIQDSLTKVRPFGGTPIAGMLEDLRYYLTNDNNVRARSSSNPTGDLFAACRPRKAILITDGAPDAMFRDARFRCNIEESPTDPSQRIATGLCNVSNSHPTANHPNPGCSCPYKAPERIAGELTGRIGNSPMLEKLIVVAYNVHDATALRTLNAIGDAAGFFPRDVTDPNYRNLIIADGAGDLRRKIDVELNVAPLGGSSRSVLVSVNVGDPSVNGSSKRFDISAGFQAGQNTADPWAGFLYRGRAICGSRGVQDEPYAVGMGDSFHDRLTAQSRRNLLTATPEIYGTVDGSLINANYVPRPVQSTDRDYAPQRLPTNWDSVNHRRPDGRDFSVADRVVLDLTPIITQGLVNERINVPDINNPNFTNTSALNSLYFGDATHDNVPGTAADRAAVVNYTLGVGRTNKLADIYHSQPVVMVPVNSVDIKHLSTIDARYTTWLRALISTSTGAHYDTAGRPGVVFVGTNDGVLHAFNLDDWSNRGTSAQGGNELWGFVPPALFGKMASMLDTHQTGFDGSPQLKDVVLQSRSGYAPIYRSILVSAISGAHAFVAMDVTYPEEPVFLWQFSAPDVGNTIGNVGITQVNVNWPGVGEMVRAVAIVPGGEGIANSLCANGDRFSPENGKTRAQYPQGSNRDVRCWTRRGRGLYVVDVATGQLLQQFGFEHFPSPLTGSVAVDGSGMAASTAAYTFDHDGVLWRLSMVSTDPSNWKVMPIYDMFTDPPAPKNSAPAYQLGRHPLFAPTLTRDLAGNLVIVAGTGDLDSPFDNATNRVISLTEKRGTLQDGEIAAEISLNWRIDLDPWTAVTGPLTLFQDTVYFATSSYSDDSDQCAAGSSTQWGVHAYKAQDSSSSVPRPQPRLKRSTANDTDPLVESEFLGDRTLLVGLTVRQQPVCVSTSVTYNAVTQQTTPNAAANGGGYQLIGSMSSGSAHSTAHASDSALGTVAHSAPQNLRPVYTSKVTSWTSMFE